MLPAFSSLFCLHLGFFLPKIVWSNQDCSLSCLCFWNVFFLSCGVFCLYWIGQWRYDRKLGEGMGEERCRKWSGLWGFKPAISRIRHKAYETCSLTTQPPEQCWRDIFKDMMNNQSQRRAESLNDFIVFNSESYNTPLVTHNLPVNR